MYVVDIYDAQSCCAAGPCWVTGKELSLKDAIQKARQWIEESENPSIYEVMYRVVGCL